MTSCLWQGNTVQLNPLIISNTPDSKIHGASMEPIWGRQDPGGPYVGLRNFATWDFEAVTKWPPFYRHFVLVFVWKLLCFDSDLSEVCSQVSVQGSDNGLVPNRRQTTISTNDCKFTDEFMLGHDELTHRCFGLLTFSSHSRTKHLSVVINLGRLNKHNNIFTMILYNVFLLFKWKYNTLPATLISFETPISYMF